MRQRDRLRRGLWTLALLPLLGCGDPGLPPGAEIAHRAGEDLQVFLREARQDRRGRSGRAPGFTVGAAGEWKVVAFDPPRRGFRIMTPPGFVGRIQSPTKVLVFSEGRDRVVLHPAGAPTMAFEFHVPEPMRLRREREDPSEAPIHFPGAEVWVAREGQDIVLEWPGRDRAHWLGDLRVYDSYGRPLPLEGQLDLPSGWVGVPSGMPVFRVGEDRAYGPYREIEPGVWTAVDHPHPLELSLLPGIFVEVAERLGPRPGPMPEVVVDSCGTCERPGTLPPISPEGAGDDEVLWIRLGSPALLDPSPGPLQTQPLRAWIRTSPRDPTGHALLTMYAQVLFPKPQAALLGLQFLPPPSLSRSLEELMRRWTVDTPGQDARVLVEDVLPGILFECRSADPEGFDRAVRNLVHRARPVLFSDLTAELERVAARTLTPLRVRGLVE